MELIDGKSVANTIAEELKAEVAQMKARKPCVAFIRVGEDPASVSYVRGKQKKAEAIGIESRLAVFPESITQEELHKHIDQLNNDPLVDGILVQSPLPGTLNDQAAFNQVKPDKDVDGLTTLNQGLLCQDNPNAFVPCTPAGVAELLKRYDIATSGKHVVVVGRSQLVGKPAALLFLRKGEPGNATVTVCHSRTADLPRVTSQADILVAALGMPRFIKKEMVKEGAVVIDVGLSRIPDASRKSGTRLVGDVDFDAVAPVCSHITPAPGGVGPMTVIMLMQNTIKAYYHHNV